MTSRSNRWLWVAVALVGVFMTVSFAAAARLAEAAIHPAVWRIPGSTAALASSISSTAQKIQITATDGVKLNAWWLRPSPAADGRRAVIICHGIGDSAYGALGFAPLFLSHGYSVLVPDSRGHGESSGFVTFGVLESGDIVQWVKWIQVNGATEVFGLGESLGAAILIQALAKGAQLNAVVAESAFSSFESAADQRVDRVLPKPLARIVVWEAALYVAIRYGVNVMRARPDLAIAKTTAPVLLIHGLADLNTSPQDSIRLSKINPAFTEIWLVPGAKHTGAYAAAPEEFEAKVLGLFSNPRAR